MSAAAVQFQGQVGLFAAGGRKPCYRCFVGDAFDTDDCDTCAEQGVLGALTATVGGFAALMAIRAIVGIGEDVAGSLFLFDGAELDWRKIRLAQGPRLPDLPGLGFILPRRFPFRLGRRPLRRLGVDPFDRLFQRDRLGIGGLRQGSRGSCRR